MFLKNFLSLIVLLVSAGLHAGRGRPKKKEYPYGSDGYALLEATAYLHNFEKSALGGYHQYFSDHRDLMAWAKENFLPLWAAEKPSLKLSHAMHCDKVMIERDEACRIQQSRRWLKLKRRMIIVDNAAMFEKDNDPLPWIFDHPVFFKNFMLAARSFLLGAPIALICDMQDADNPGASFWVSIGMRKGKKGKLLVSRDDKYDWGCYDMMLKVAQECVDLMESLDRTALDLLYHTIYPTLLNEEQLYKFLTTSPLALDWGAAVEQFPNHLSKQVAAVSYLYAGLKDCMPYSYLEAGIASCGLSAALDLARQSEAPKKN